MIDAGLIDMVLIDMVLIDTVAWVRVEHGRILCARPGGKDIFYIPGGKREGTESDLQALCREIAEFAWFGYADRPRVPPVDQLLFDDLNAAGALH
jgi:8-oxo-dGTP diphosphatase